MVSEMHLGGSWVTGECVRRGKLWICALMMEKKEHLSRHIIYMWSISISIYLPTGQLISYDFHISGSGLFVLLFPFRSIRLAETAGCPLFLHKHLLPVLKSWFSTRLPVCSLACGCPAASQIPTCTHLVSTGGPRVVRGVTKWVYVRSGW